ncbi:hypothetical protein SOVF_087390 [Spinacia oleracea]|nr:hypothetical protein SOVF_087390 [Spinacia oleracea]
MISPGNDHILHRKTNSHDLRRETEYLGDEDDGEGEEFDGELWKMLSSRLERVQSVLDENSALIQRVNENHQSKNLDNLAKNGDLICEINGNISKILSMYSDLSIDFTNLVCQRKFMWKNCDNGWKEGVNN